jgi:DNA segregation ATPase FtsK/SpoIIIE, S-DNA-T family
VPLEDRTPLQVKGKKVTAGDYVGELLTWLAKKGPAAGIVLILATQRPDSKTIPSGLRAVLGSRLALRVMDWRDSNIVLGEQMNTRGYDASRLLPSHKGVGILRPDGETDAGADVLAVTVRTDYMSNEDWRTICTRARALRGEENTLSGHAAGQGDPALIGPGTVIDAYAHVVADHVEPTTVIELPEPLGSVVDYLGEHEDGRDFIPSAEITEALGVEPTTFGRQMSELGCGAVRGRIATEEGVRQVRGYVVRDVRQAAEHHASPDRAP